METVVNPSETEEELHKPAFGDNGERLKSFSPFDPLRNATPLAATPVILLIPFFVRFSLLF